MLQKAIRITSFDVFPNGTVKLSALQRYMQQLAREDCDQMGCTYAAMRRENMVFVLTKLGIDIRTPIRSGDVLVCKTFNNRVEGITYFREFDFKLNGETAIRATTQWVVVRFDTRSIVRPRDVHFGIPEYNFKIKEVEVPRRFDVFEDLISAGSRKVNLSDLDENHHLNNCVYSDIAMDFLPLENKDFLISSLKMIFKHEALQEDVLNICYKKTEQGFYVSAHNQTKNVPCFESIITIK